MFGVLFGVGLAGPVADGDEHAAAAHDRAGLVLIDAAFRVALPLEWKLDLPADVLAGLGVPGERELVVVGVPEAGRAAPVRPVGGRPDARGDEKRQERGE